MFIHSKQLDELAINTIRFLSVDGVQKANSGHPGMPMACAPIVYVLYSKYMKHNPANPKWLNRDRFVLSAGHGSMLLYSILHLCGYDLSLDELKNFRQWRSKTPGHPEFGLTPGVETTTGPLGQGFANAVGMAIAQAFLAANFNQSDLKILDHYIYGICSDGDLMEGISHEAASLAGHLKLNKIIFFYDNNGISIDGKTSLAYSDDVQKRFEAYNWNVLHVRDVNDVDEIETAIQSAQKSLDKPTLIITNTHIGFGSPNKQDTSEAHGSPLGEEEVKLSKKNLGWRYDELFYVPQEVRDHFKQVKMRGEKQEVEWQKLFDDYKKKYPEKSKQLMEWIIGDLGNEWKVKLPVFEDDGKKIATRAASGNVIESLAASIPNLIGGSADLTPSNNTRAKIYEDFSASNYKGRYIRFGVREHSMVGILNGMALYGGVIPYGGTFLVFADYMRPSIRLASLSGIRPIYIFTHDSIGLGEDGPTHQSVEQLASLHAIPKLIVIRPADANETVYAWKAALEHKESPVALILSRQGLPILDQKKFPSAEGLLKGAYILYDSSDKPVVILMASGSEVDLSLRAARELEKEGIKVRAVSFPSWELFEMQPHEYKESVLPSSVLARVSVEAGVAQGWQKYTGRFGANISIEKYGASAPEKVLMEKYGFNVENVCATSKKVMSGLIY
ncbi:MAG: transketolase [Ignavibacteria bacterium RIFOXYC12_FULL_35_11]|nr:MAG: transketolase [Ignavibacteria bacterium RIFOXYC12_FULL_35_11]